MKRIDLRYGGEHYSIAGRDVEDVQGEIRDALRSDEPHWLEANYGEGSARAAHLLVVRGTAISLMPIGSD